MSTPRATAARLKAVALAGRWQVLVQRHLPLRGGPCACVMGIGNIAVADFEIDLLDFLHTRYARDGALDRHFAHAGYEEAAAGSLLLLLQSLARDQALSDGAGDLLDGLQASLQSLEAGH
ncbi:MAG: hypothetical protein E2576_13155 [Alcaligenaceae bacterium]|nr:hypothetical protein [Alcaligenaceae bacterium SAGV5]MPS53102.1 hypothetical protein [Alcaligenaceae bacterium SAGV3]MPT57661.1 hypothetical protein [Alcaligenaceae bacterium]